LIDIPTLWTARRGANSSAISATAQKEALIVDDDVARGNCFRSSVTDKGFEVATVHDGRAAIASSGRESEAICRDHYRSALARGRWFDVLRAAHDANPSVYVGVERFPAGGAGGGEADTLREGGNPKTEDRRPGTED